MLKSAFKFLGFNRNAKTPKPNPRNERKVKGKLTKVRHHPANTSVSIADRPPTTEKEFTQPYHRRSSYISTVDTEGKHSGEHYQNQPAGLSLIDPSDIHDIDATHPLSPHTQTYENNDLSSSIFVDPSRNSGGKKPRAQAPISGDPNRLPTPTPSVRRDSFGRGNSFQTHEWDGDHGGVQDWIDSGPDYILKRIMAPERSTPFNVDPHQHEAQEHHDENDILKKESQQQNSETHTPIVSQSNPLEKDENRARRENVSKHDHRKREKAAGHGDRVKDSFEPEIYYYIVPAGLDIIFQDEDGTEITRVGKTIKGTQDHASHTHTRNIPIVVQDILGNELFRSDLDQHSLEDRNPGLPSPNHTSWKTVIVDEKGKQIPLKYAERKGRSTSSFPT